MLVMSFYVNYATTKFIAEKFFQVLNDSSKFSLILNILHLTCYLFSFFLAETEQGKKFDDVESLVQSYDIGKNNKHS